jgi:gluconate 5-dehydrogenase
MNLNLDNLNVFIIGGANNLGFDMAEGFVKNNSNVFITSRKEESLNKSIKCLNQINKSSTIKGGVLNVLDKNFEKNLQNILKESDFKPDVLINNQGGQSQVFNRFPNLEKDDLLEEFNLNLISVILSIQIFYEELLKSKYPSIINVASIAGMVGRDREIYTSSNLPEQRIEYASAKAGIIGLTKDLAAKLGPEGIRVNCISPGGFERGQPKNFIDQYSFLTPLKRMGADTKDITLASLFLASPNSSYINGHNLVVDGGFTSAK